MEAKQPGRVPTVEELRAMILEARREPGIWRAEVQAKWLAQRIARHMGERAAEGK